MRIGFISTYPPMDCGIATYSSYLIEKLRNSGNSIYIVSEKDARGKGVYPAYSKQDTDLAQRIFETMIKINPDIVHIQHEYGLFGLHHGVNVIPLIYKFKLSKIPVISTLHTVYEYFSYHQKLIIEAIIRASDAVIVHEEYQKESIYNNIGFFDNIFVIPHGVRKVSFIPDAKFKLGVENKKVILLIGYLRPTKNFDLMVKIFPKIKQKVPNSLLIISSGVRMHEYTDYLDSFTRLINSSPAKDSIMFLNEKSPQSLFDTTICSADVAAMPYKVGAQSGIMAHLLAFGIPLVTSDLKAFEETFKKSRCGFSSKTEEDYIRNIVDILTDNKLRNELSSAALRLVNKELSWETVAKKTVEVYKKIINNHYITQYLDNKILLVN